MGGGIGNLWDQYAEGASLRLNVSTRGREAAPSPVPSGGRVEHYVDALVQSTSYKFQTANTVVNVHIKIWQ